MQIWPIEKWTIVALVAESTKVSNTADEFALTVVGHDWPDAYLCIRGEEAKQAEEKAKKKPRRPFGNLHF